MEGKMLSAPKCGMEIFTFLPNIMGLVVTCSCPDLCGTGKNATRT
jgi:hypothetical protein